MAEKKKGKIEKVDLSMEVVMLWQLFMNNLKWFPISIVACLIVAAFYIWFTPSTRGVVGKMEIIDRSKNGSSGMSAGMALLNSLPLNLGSSLGRSGSLAVDAEKEILLSNTLVSNVVKDLGIYTEYRLSRCGRKSLLYQNTPITVSLDSAHVEWFDAELPLTSHQIQLTVTKNSNGYKVKTKLVENKDKTSLPTKTFTKLPATIETEFGTITIIENILPPKQANAFKNDYKLLVTVSPPISAADGFISRITADPPSKTVTNMLKITLQEENVMRGIDFIKGLVKAYNQRANDDKNAEAIKTDDFVNARLAKIDVELGSSDDAWENSKKQYQITTPEVDAQEALTKKSQYEIQLVEIGTKIQLHDFLNDFINDPKNLFDFIPVSLMDGSSESQASSNSTGTSSFIAQHNQLVKQRNDILKSVSDKSPQVQRLTESIQELHPTIQLAMQRDREQLVMQKNTLDREYARYSGRIGSAPQMERVFTEIGREREIKQAVYLLLLQKREEIAMELANTTDKGRLIDTVKIDSSTTKPQKKMVLLIALFIGGILPLTILFLLQMIKPKIDTRREIEMLTMHPFLCEVSSVDIDESIRNLRTKLLLKLTDEQKTILVSSQKDAEGKTFIAQHLTDSLNSIGKKAVYVNADLRNSIIKESHPADILASEEFAQQLAKAKADNDYVILDSPALSKYVDALQLAKFADVTLYVVKAGATTKSDVELLNNYESLPQPMVILNVVK